MMRVSAVNLSAKDRRYIGDGDGVRGGLVPECTDVVVAVIVLPHVL